MSNEQELVEALDVIRPALPVAAVRMSSRGAVPYQIRWSLHQRWPIAVPLRELRRELRSEKRFPIRSIGRLTPDEVLELAQAVHAHVRDRTEWFREQLATLARSSRVYEDGSGRIWIHPADFPAPCDPITAVYAAVTGERHTDWTRAMWRIGLPLCVARRVMDAADNPKSPYRPDLESALGIPASALPDMPSNHARKGGNV
jgi:hypothetical protein